MLSVEMARYEDWLSGNAPKVIWSLFLASMLHHLQILKSSVIYDWTLCFYGDLWLYRNGLQQTHSAAVLSIENDIASQKRVFE